MHLYSSEILAWFFLFLWSPYLATLPTSSSTLDVQLIILYSGCGERAVSLFGSILPAGGAGCSFTCPHFPPQGNSWVEGFSWLHTVLAWIGVGMMWVKSNFLFSNVSRPIFFFFSGVLELLCWKPGLPQRLSHAWMTAYYSIFQELLDHN